jgi:3-oxoacyl-[acyl-carrier protein] reductase
MCQRLLNKNAIVTGGARGMGFAIAKALYHEGARVALLDIDEKGVKEAAQELALESGRALGRRVDITQRGEVFQFVKEMKDQWGTIDILVNNAGGALNTPHFLEKIEDKDWNLVLDVNLKGTFLCCQAVIPEMVKQRGRNDYQHVRAGRPLEGLPGRGSLFFRQGRGGGFNPSTRL